LEKKFVFGGVNLSLITILKTTLQGKIHLSGYEEKDNKRLFMAVFL
jgi:hypothetical protein